MGYRSRKRRKVPAGPVELTIESLSHDGRGVARIEGKTGFVDNALPGERVQAHYAYSKRQYDELVTDELLGEPHPDRVEPPCPHAQICGGCSLQHLDPDAQIRHKQSVLAEQLKHFGDLEPEQWVEPLIADRRGYRTKARLGVRYVHKRGEVLIGFRERHSNFLTAMTECTILVDEFTDHLETLRDVLSATSIRDQIPQLELACGEEGKALIVRHMAPFTDTDLDSLRGWSQGSGFALYLQSKGPDTVTLLCAPDEYDGLYFGLDDGSRLRFEPTDFTQVNLPMNRKMVQRAIDWLSPHADETVLDLFCGLGNFSVALARRAGRVIGVEGSVAMTERAAENARRNQLENVRFEAADLHREDLLQNETPTWVASVDALLLDPPRTGAEAICRDIGVLNPRRIVYVSCNPATLARDAGLLAQNGYRLLQAGVMDMFPHTTHVESIALFERQN